MTEVVFEVSHLAYPLCRFTREHRDARGVYRVVDTGATSGVFRAIVTLIAPSELAASFLKELKASPRHDEFEVLSVTPTAVMARVGHRLPEARQNAGVVVAPVERLLEAFGGDTILEPFAVEGGAIRMRCLVPQPIETKRVLVKLQEIQRATAWDHFRVIRVAEFKALKYANVLRRLLTSEQEDILRLALSLGYYSSPKGCTLEDIARRVGLSVSPVHKKLKHVEQTLINAHVDPAAAEPPEPRRRPRDPYGILASRAAAERPGSICEVSVRVRWSAHAPLAFTARRPGARVVHQTLVEDARAGATTALLVAVTPAGDYGELLDHVQRHPSVTGIEVTSRGPDHVSLKLRTTLPTAESWRHHANPFAHLPHRFGRDAFLKPVVMEGEDLWMKVVVVRGLPNGEIVERLELAAKEAGWDEVEVLSIRRVDVDPAVMPLPQPEKMTARQEEVLKIAHALGYYKTPRECTLEHVAQTLGISANAIHKNLTAAEQKIICTYLSAGF